jgi:hypothetical protein
MAVSEGKNISEQISRLRTAKNAIKTAIEGKGVTVPDTTLLDAYAALIDSIEAGGGGDVLNFFGGSKYCITEATPTSDTEQITITPDDTTILDSPKFLLVTQDIPAARNEVQTRAIARAPSAGNYISALIAFSIGQVCVSGFACISSYDGSSSYSRVYSDINGGDAFDGSYYVTISGGGMTLDVENPATKVNFKGGQTYKVLLIG